MEDWVRLASFLPIVACSVVGMGVTLWKWRQLRAPTLPPRDHMVEIQERLRSGRYREAVTLAEQAGGRVAVILGYVFRQPWRASHVAERVAFVGANLARELEYGLGALGIIATLGPLFGLLGTVVGITLVFDRFAQTGGAATPEELAGGIGTALHTTIAGLIVGVLALVCHRVLAAKVDRVVGQLEAVGQEITEVAHGESG